MRISFTFPTNQWTALTLTVKTSGMKQEAADAPCGKFPASQAESFS